MDPQGLPPGWSVGYDSVTGFPYFIDHINKITTWEDPRKSKNQLNSSPNLRSVPNYSSENLNLRNKITNNLNNNGQVVNHSSTNCSEEDIPRKKQSYYENASEPIPIKVHPVTSSSFGGNDNHHDRHHKQQDQRYEQQAQPFNSSSDKPNHHNDEVPSSIPVKIADDNTENSDNSETTNHQSTPLDPMSLIEQAQSELEEVKAEINEFFPSFKDKKYLFLEDKLEKLTLRLDNIDSAGDSAIRNKRREVILAIQNVLKNLEDKLANSRSLVKLQSNDDNQEGDAQLTDKHVKNNKNTVGKDDVPSLADSEVDSRKED
ncbi:unnamed protein product [Trichobilharzia szidati]|nr:unnamed protein product [Trichobilharzia szidati]